MHSPVPCLLDLFEMDQPHLLSLHHTLSKESQQYSFRQICQYQQQHASTHQQFDITYEDRERFYCSKFQLENEMEVQGQEEDDGMDLMQAGKGKQREEDKFEISKTVMIYHEVSIPHYELSMEGYSFDQNPINQFFEDPNTLHLPHPSREFLLGRLPKKLDRRMRVERYLQKKAKRCFIKKVSYACRKVVADQRIRVKGRFIAKGASEGITQKDLLAKKEESVQVNQGDFMQNNDCN